ncbi:DUF2523 family protein [Comamonas testosteroni]|uniref:DUF2523 family protein n=1 Tax=Comamonas testosteroni TaxID=285 RepID=UPI0026EAE2A1|nr:DUF2523 family protein [Comamonas testosteroni]
MFGILMSAFGSSLGWVFRVVVIKFIVFTVLFVVVSAFMAAIVNYGVIPSFSNAQSMAGNISSGAAYIFSLFKIWTGISMIITAYITRFMIRRIPFIG